MQMCIRDSRKAVRRADRGGHLAGAAEVPGPDLRAAGLRALHPVSYTHLHHSHAPEQGPHDCPMPERPNGLCQKPRQDNGLSLIHI